MKIKKSQQEAVTQWLRAAQISDDFRQTFYHIPNIVCKGDDHPLAPAG